MFGLGKKEDIKTDDVIVDAVELEDNFDDELGYQRIAKKVGKYEVYNPNEEEDEKLLELLIEIEKKSKSLKFDEDDIVNFFNLLTNIPMTRKRYDKLMSKRLSNKFTLVTLALQEVIQEFYDSFIAKTDKVKALSDEDIEKIKSDPIIKQKLEKQALRDEWKAKEDARILADKQKQDEIDKLLARVEAIKNGNVEVVETKAIPDMTEEDIVTNYPDSLPKVGE